MLSHTDTISADASGAAARGSVLTVIADAVTDFEPDHILIALHDADHADWQERKLIEHIERALRPASDDVRGRPPRAHADH